MKSKHLLIMKLLTVFFILSVDSYANYENETLSEARIAVVPGSRGLGFPGSETPGMNQGFPRTTPSSNRLFQDGDGDGTDPDNPEDEEAPVSLPVPDSLSLMLALGLSYFFIKEGRKYLTSKKRDL